MVHCSKILLNTWLFLFFALSIPYTIVAWLYSVRRGYHKGGQTCFVDTVWIPIAYGVFMGFLCLLGMIGSLCRLKPLQKTFNYIVNTLTVFTLLVTLFYFFTLPRVTPLLVWDRVYNNTVPYTKAYKPFLQTVLLSDGKWSGVQHCLNEIHLCDPNFADTPDKKRIYSLLMQGCCNPPSRCGLRNSTNENHWEAPKTGLPPNDADCEKWTKINDGMCLDCDTCKGSYLAKFHGDWKGIAYFDIVFFLFILMITIFTGCGAFTELQRSRQ